MTPGQPDTAAARRLSRARGEHARGDHVQGDHARSLARAQLLARLALAALLLLGVAAGIGAADPAITARGPLHRYGTVVAAGLELVLIVLLVAVGRRRARLGMWSARLPYLLNSILVPVLRASVIVLPVWVFLNLLHVVLIHGTPRKLNPVHPKLRPYKARSSALPDVRVIVAVILLLMLIAVLICLLLIVRWRRAARVSNPMVPDEDLSGQLRQAVQAGRRALAGLDEARAAIIACYVAMEQTLATAGAVRAVAETPDELLARAVAAGLVRGEAAGQLTALFYQARFSARPLPGGSLAAARQALAELAAELSGPRGTAVTAR